MQEKTEIQTKHGIVDLIEFGHVDINIIDTFELERLLNISIELERYECCKIIHEEITYRNESE